MRNLLTFHLNWVEVDPSVDLLLTDLAPREQWFQWDQDGTIKHLFLHTVTAGSHAVHRTLARAGCTYAEQCDVIAHGLTVLSLSPPYDALPLQAGTLAHMAFTAQAQQAAPIGFEDLPVPRHHIMPGHFLAATEAAFGFALSLLHAYAADTKD